MILSGYIAFRCCFTLAVQDGFKAACAETAEVSQTFQLHVTAVRVAPSCVVVGTSLQTAYIEVQSVLKLPLEL